MQNTIKFEMADWEEIIEALHSKIGQIHNGQLGPEDRPNQDKEWIEHLHRIIRKTQGRKSAGIHLAVFKKSVITTTGGKSS